MSRGWGFVALMLCSVSAAAGDVYEITAGYTVDYDRPFYNRIRAVAPECVGHSFDLAEVADKGKGVLQCAKTLDFGTVRYNMMDYVAQPVTNCGAGNWFYQIACHVTFEAANGWQRTEQAYFDLELTAAPTEYYLDFGDEAPCDPCGGSPLPPLQVGDPIEPRDGNSHQRASDYRGRGAQSLALTRTYNSRARSSVGAFGAGWRHGYEHRLQARYQVEPLPLRSGTHSIGRTSGLYSSPQEACEQGGAELITRFADEGYDTSGWAPTFSTSGGCTFARGGAVVRTAKLYGNTHVLPQTQPSVLIGYELRRANGAVYAFDLQGGVLVPQTPRTGTLTQSADGFTYTSASGRVERYDSAGRLISITTRDGARTQLSYEGDLLREVRNGYGEALSFSYQSGRISSVTSPDGVIRYGYEAERLIQVTYPDQSSRHYHYEDARHPNALTGLTDERGVRYASWAYDEAGRAVLSVNGSGNAGRTELAYPNAATVAVTRYLDAERQQTTTFRFAYVNNSKRVVETQGGPCVGCGREGRLYTYTPEGWVESVTDYNGQVTRYAYNARGLVTRKIEAAGTPEERVTETAWHPSWSLPVEIREPTQITHISYDDKGRVLSRTVSPR